MKYFITIIISLFLCSTTVFSQYNNIRHRVVKGETVSEISKKYKVSATSIYRLNPKARKKLSIGQVLIIHKFVSQKKRGFVATNSRETTEIIYLVLPKETKFEIAKKYGISIASLENQNPSIRKKLLAGKKLKIQTPRNITKISETKEEISTSETKEETSTSETKELSDSIASNKQNENQELINNLIKTASKKIGKRYRKGGNGPKVFDCSGFIFFVFKKNDINLPRTSLEQSTVGKKIEMKDAKEGDLIFFKTRGKKRINHVGMVINVNGNEIKFIHSSVHSGVTISSSQDPYYKKKIVQLNQVIQSEN